MKCRDYETYSVLCQKCDIKTDVACEKKFNFNQKEKYINVERKDSINTTWKACPTCGSSIGYQPLDEDFRCPKCNQAISWK